MEEIEIGFKEAQNRDTLAFINPFYSDTIFINANGRTENLIFFPEYIEEILEHETIHLVLLRLFGISEARDYDKIHYNVDNIPYFQLDETKEG